MSQPLPAHRAARSPGPARAWRAAAVALSVALTLGLAAPEARAVSLGRITVQSALGEPLRAEIDIPQITPDEVASLRTALASPEAFRAAGIERNPALADLRISLQQRPGGGYFLRLASDRAINEPFLDLIIEASAPTGRIVREYTLLFDPPSLRQGAAPPAPIAAQVPPSEPAPAAPADPATSPPAATAAPAPATTPAAPPPPAAQASAPASASPAGRRITVQGGQTASAIAAAAKPRNVSLDQMLVSLLRNNPDAFIGGNVNRLKAGAVLELPTETQAAGIAPAEARQTLVAQSKDFNEFRQRLAEGVGNRAPVAQAPGRAASGQVEARVEDKKAAPGAGDRLTLSKGAIEEPSRDGKAAEDRIARERAERDAAARASEIERNIAELRRLGSEAAPAGAPAPAASAASATADAGPGIALPASAPGPAPVAAPVDADADGLSTLIDGALLPAAAGGTLALLLALALYRRRRKPAPFEATTADSQLPPDSFFAGNGDPRVDGTEGASSMMYSPSQLDAAGDVDPVAEADVYLAYGRDLQAEEILLEALRTTPQRVAVHAKLLEIYARRNDVRAFEPIARDAHALTSGSGPQWSAIASLGRELDPGNPLYRTEPGQAPAAPASDALPALDPDAARGEAPAQQSPPVTTAPAAVPPGLDLDLASFKPAAPPAPPEAGAGRDHPFDFSDEPAASAQDSSKGSPSLDFDLAGLSLEVDPPAGTAASQAPADPLATKLSLAEEFRTLGDVDGARSLVQEVLAEARGEMRQRAERLLAEIG